MDSACPERGSKLYRDGRCMACSIRRQQDQQEQMRSRSGPEYDKSVTRAKIGTAAWNAAGRPRRPFQPLMPGRESRWYLCAPFKRHRQLIEATPEQVAAYLAYQAEAMKLRARQEWRSAGAPDEDDRR
jgi:hypothetical protein